MRFWTLLAPLVFVLLSANGAVAQSPAPPVLHYCMGCNLSGATLTGADFSGVTYVGTNFGGAALERASFRGAHLVAANFQSANLRGAAFDDVDCTACNFEGAKLDGATFSGIRMVAANFADFSAVLSDADLRGLLGGCVACNFRSATLAGRDFSGVTMIDVDLSRADLRNSRFNGAVLCWYVVNGSQRSPKCNKLSGARVEGASFLGVLICADPSAAQSCSAVTATALRHDSESTLAGATLP